MPVHVHQAPTIILKTSSKIRSKDQIDPSKIQVNYKPKQRT